MNLFFVCRICCVFLLTVPEVLLSQQPQPPPKSSGDQLVIPARVLPIGPRELLSLLPAVPPGWKVTTSQAANQISSWLLTVAQRQIEAPSSRNGAATGSRDEHLPPMRTTFMLIDTGYDPSPAGAFVDFNPTRGANVEKVFFRGYPVIKTRSSAASESLQTLINQRFALRIETQNQPKDATLSWMQQVPFERYNVPRGTAMTTLPPNLTVAAVDELNPANNHESKATIGEHAPTERR